MSSQNNRDRLDVEDEQDRQTRLQNLLQNVNIATNGAFSTASTRSPSILGLGDGDGTGIGQDRGPRPLEGPNQLLARLEAFLPQIAASNAELLRRAQVDPASVDIENLTPGVGDADGSEIENENRSYIEMNLGLGVFEQRRRGSAGTGGDMDDVDQDSDDTLSSLSSSSSSASLSSSGSESGSDPETDGEHRDADAMDADPASAPPRSSEPTIRRPRVALPRRARDLEPSGAGRPEIVELASSDKAKGV